MVNKKYALRSNVTEKKNYILFKFIKETIILLSISKISCWNSANKLNDFDQEFC